jgi:hypothetical protein
VGAAEAAAVRAVAAGGAATQPASPPAPSAASAPTIARPAAKPLVTNTPGAAPVPATPPPASTSTSTGRSLSDRLAAATGSAASPSAGYPSSEYAADSQATSAFAPPSARGSYETSSSSPAEASSGVGATGAAGAAGGPRTARLTIASVDPWSVLKLSFLLSVALGIATVVASIVLWLVLNGMGIFDQINGVLGDISGTGEEFDVFNYVGFGRVLSLSTVVGVVNVVLITALSTIGAFLYNLGAGLVGGLHVTLSDD